MYFSISVEFEHVEAQLQVIELEDNFNVLGIASQRRYRS